MAVDALRAVVDEARAIGAVVASDECYVELAWEDPWLAAPVPSVLDPAVARGSHQGLLALYSLSKQSNMAGYRAAFVAGDPELVAGLLETRKHVGMMVPDPVQRAMVAALGDDAHVADQRAVYGARREILASALTSAGFTIDDSVAGLYLWATRGEDSWDTIAWLADRGIVAAPGAFYGVAGTRHVRLALTVTDERLTSAARRLVNEQ